ncbi:Mobile element protein [Methanosarcina mazei Tuc01]|uniref:Mobile element protein n=1 Tax=Methanosarcina mazei Tuc01 TaxID=1236903 RepID=M1QC31_METMZ|nr:hypothetical protein [Methanosarcina mazei]AGF97808.1 Mobile element protein [Methanosarcina mazei Tuc01]
MLVGILLGPKKPLICLDEKPKQEEEAKKILDKIEFHYTPKHASWQSAGFS